MADNAEDGLDQQAQETLARMRALKLRRQRAPNGSTQTSARPSPVPQQRGPKAHSLLSTGEAAKMGARVQKCFKDRWATPKCDGPDVCAQYNVCNRWGLEKAVAKKANADLEAAGCAERVPDNALTGGRM